MRPGTLRLYLAALGAILPHAAAPAQDNAMMVSSSRAVAMDVTRQSGLVVVSVVGHSAVPKTVRFAIDVEGASTTRNLARSTVGPDSRTLSVVRFSDVPPWRVTLDVDEQGGGHYTLHASDKAID